MEVLLVRNSFARISFLALVCTISFAAKGAAVPAVAATPAPANGCTAELLMEADSGQVLSELNAQTPLPPASMVKIMVAYVTLKKIKEGVVRYDDVVTASAFASKIGGSQVYLKEKEQFTVRELLEAVLVQSANDGAMALAEHIGGTPEGFVELMNAEAQRLGMKDAVYTSPHGLPPGKGQEPDLVSAYDMAVLSRALLKDFPEALELTGKMEQGFRNGAFIMRNHNSLLKSFNGCDGIKTGFYNKAGFCISATAKRKDVRLIAVVMGCAERKKRDQEAARILSLGFAAYRSQQLVQQGAPADRAVPVVNGTLREVTPVAKSDLSAVLKIGDEARLVKETELCPSVTAPVANGVECGSIRYVLDGREVGRVPLVVLQEIPALSLRQKLLRKIW